MNLKTALLAVAAAVAFLGAALVAVPMSGDRPVQAMLQSIVK